jgi:6-phospho-beta-glucosidase
VADAIENNKKEYHVVNVKNGGALPFMEDDDVVEVKCLLGRGGAAPVPVTAPQSDYIVGLVRAVKAYERLAVRAAVNRSYPDALAALMVHPLIGDYRRAKAVLDDMLEQNQDYIKLEG